MRSNALLAASLCCFGCTARGEPAEPSPVAKTVRCSEVKTAQIAQWVELRGTLAPLPDRDAQVAAQVSGRILHVEVREGDRVKAGQTLARVDSAQLIDQVHEADAALARVQAERLNAETTLARVQRVFEHGIAARQEVDDAAARAAAARASEAETAAAAKRAHLQLERAAVVSPLDGVVLKLMKRSGELVDGTPATPILEVGDPAQLELVADAPAPDLVRVKRGDSAAIALSALPGLELHGQVSAVAPSVDRASGLGVVRVALEAPQSATLPVGSFGTARVQAGAKRDAAVVPIGALRGVTGSDAELVVCGADRLAHVRKVRRGELNGSMVEIASGVTAGERIVVEPVLGVGDGEPIKVLP
jgi:RND family efflux transporter MFP subunit